MPTNRRGSSLSTHTARSRDGADEAPAIVVTLGTGSVPRLRDGSVETESELNRSRTPAEVALGNAVFAHIRRMHGPNVHVSVTFGTEAADECFAVGIRPDPSAALIEAIAAIREDRDQTGEARTSSVRVVLPDGIVLDAGAETSDEVSLFESADGHLAILVDGWAVTGFERLVGWRLVPDGRALLAGDMIPTHTRWVHDGAVLVVWTDGRFLLNSGGVPIATQVDDALEGAVSRTGAVGSRVMPKAEIDPWLTTWAWIASVTRDGEVRHAEDLSPRCRRILDLPPSETPDAEPTPVRPARMRRRG